MRIMIALIVMALMASCANIKINENEGTFEYSRVGNQELINVQISIAKSADGDIIMEGSLGKARSDSEIKDALHEILQMLQELREPS